jgi:hypothetical protein
MKTTSQLRASDWVEVRSKEEILSTLDKEGQLECLPFMPEMFEFCGKRFRVSKRAHKTCDPVNGLGGRRMSSAVHLEGVRCGGDAHGGCQARCLLFWKNAWLRKIDANGNPAPDINPAQPQRQDACSEQDVIAATRKNDNCACPDDPAFICQSTQLAQATKPIRWWDIRQYVEDYTSGNVLLSQLLGSLLFFCYDKLVWSGVGLGSALRWLYDTAQKIRGGTPYPLRLGKIPQGAKTPLARLDLQPGDLVKIRSYEDILATINEERQNRGMWFDAEMVPYCGGTYHVLDRVSRIIDEKTGHIRQFKGDCIMLEGVICRACYSRFRKFCPRGIYSFWREIWLERVEPASSDTGELNQ